MYVKLAVHYPMYNLTANMVTSVIFIRMIYHQGLILCAGFSIVPGTRGSQFFLFSASCSCFTSAVKISKDWVSYHTSGVSVIH